jgi:hemoglobin
MTDQPYQSWQPELRMTTLSDEQISTLVHTFYGKIQQHEELGPIFEAKLAGKWDPHLAKMVDFWSTMMTGSKRYDGRPLPVHIGLPDLHDHHFSQWLVLFRETVHELFSEQIAEQFIERAERMAQSFRYAIALHEGRPLPPVGDKP